MRANIPLNTCSVGTNASRHPGADNDAFPSDRWGRYSSLIIYALSRGCLFRTRRSRLQSEFRIGTFVKSMFRYLVSLVGFAGVLITSGCASNQIEEFKKSAEGFTSYTEGEYRIGVDDVVQVNVWRNPDLSVSVPVRPDGMISVPLIGDVQAGGKTSTEVAETIRQKLSQYIRDPNVAVILSALRSHDYLSRVRVTGAVRQARSMPFRQGMTVLDAVLDAGGVNDFAAPNRTKLYRKINNRTEVLNVELGDILNKGRLETNVQLVPGDVITVPERIF